jgi:TRAP transporter TAXI family solute receptor
MYRILRAGALASVTLLTSPAVAQNFNLTALGLSPTGVMAVINTGVAAAVQEAYPGSTVTFQSGSGGIANIMAIHQGRVPLAYAVDAEMSAALAGRSPFREKIGSFRTIAYVAGYVPMHFIVTKDVAEKHDLKTFKDIAAKKPPLKIIFNTRANIVSAISEQLLKAIGVSLDDVRSWGGEIIYAPGSEHAPLFADRRANAMINMTNIRSASMVSIQRSVDVVMLSVDRAIIDKVADDAGITTMVIPKNAYDFMSGELYTLTLGIALISHSGVSDDHAYRIAKALIEHTGKFQSAHPSLKAITPQYMASLKIGQYHPGAARAFREKGLMK